MDNRNRLIVYLWNCLNGKFFLDTQYQCDSRQFSESVCQQLKSIFAAINIQFRPKLALRLIFIFVLLAFICVLLVFTCVHLCFTYVHLCSFVFTCVPLVWYFRLDHYTHQHPTLFKLMNHAFIQKQSDCATDICKQ